MPKTWGLQNKFALIFGVNQGVSISLVETFLNLGATLWIVGNDHTRLEYLIDSAPPEKKDFLQTTYIETLNKKSIAHFFDETFASIQQIDVLVNITSLSTRKSMLAYSVDELEATLQKQLVNYFVICQRSYQYMQKPTPSSIINLLSIHGVLHAADASIDGMFKSALINLTKSLACEWGKHNIRVNSVLGGLTHHEKMGAGSAQWVSTTIAKSPLRRLCEPEEIANAVSFLAMDAASCITGHCLLADAGINL